MTPVLTRPATADTVRSLEAEVVALLRRARRVTEERARLVDPALAGVGYQVLGTLREHDGCSQAVVAEVLGMDKGAVSRQVQVLVELGLVERTEDPHDRRALVVRLSPEGERRMADLEAVRRSAYLARFSEWTDPELASLVDLLGRYNATLSR